MNTIQFGAAATVLVSFAASQETQFVERLPIPSATRTSAVACGDFDGDGDLDVLCSEAEQTRLLTNDGTGRFTSSTRPIGGHSFIATGDLDGDGDTDALLGGRIPQVFRNEGPNSFRFETTVALGTRAGGGAVLDLDGDGDLDAIWGDILGTVQVALNNGSGGFSAAPGFLPPGLPAGALLQFAVADFDGDGIDDVHINGSASLVLLRTPTGVRVSTVDVPIQGAPVAGDFDGDGDVDVVVSQGGFLPTLTLMLGDDTGRFSTRRVQTVNVFGETLAAADLDEDGDLDLVSANSQLSGAPPIRLLLNDGAGTFVDATSSRLRSGNRRGRQLALGDFDGDRDVDVYVGGSGLGLFADLDMLAINRHVQVEVLAPVRVGGQLLLRGSSRPGYATGIDLYLAVVGVETAAPVPTPFGDVFVDPAGAISLPFVALGAPGGSGQLASAVPADASLAGLEFAVQALVVDLFAFESPRLTNFERVVVQ